jgi:hypothetical protein
MIEQLHVDQLDGLINLKSSDPVVQTGLEYSGRVVVGEDYIRGHTMKGETDQQPGIYNASFHTANVQHTPANDLLAIIEEDYNKLLLQGQ